jgi:hypothetical protein
MIRNKEEFTTFFESNIRPIFEDGVIKTKKKRIKQAKMVTIAFFILFFIMQVVPNIWGLLGLILLFVIFAVCVGVYIYHSKPFEVVDDKKEVILNTILSEIVPSYIFDNKKFITREEFINYSFIPPSKMDRFESSECIIGKYKGYETKISESNILQAVESNDKTKYIKIFQGLIIEVDIKSNPEYHLAISDKGIQSVANMFSNEEFVNHSKNSEEVSLSNVYLDEKYFILTNDLIKTNKILEPRHLEKISELLEQDEHKISIGFSNGKFIVLVDNKSNFFEIFDEGKFEPDVIWDELINLLKYVKWIDNLEIDFAEIN